MYSPRLEYAWENVTHPAAEPGDWFEHWRIIDYLVEEKEPINGKIVGEYCETLEKLELAALPKRRFSRNAFLYFPSILFASLLGTYLDLYFVGKTFL